MLRRAAIAKGALGQLNYFAVLRNGGSASSDPHLFAAGCGKFPDGNCHQCPSHGVGESRNVWETCLDYEARLFNQEEMAVRIQYRATLRTWVSPFQ